MPNRRSASIIALLGTGGLMLLAAAALLLSGVQLPVGKTGPASPTATLPTPKTPSAVPPPQTTAAPNSYLSAWPTLAPGVPALPIPVPTDQPPELSNPFCRQNVSHEPFCPPEAGWPTPGPPLVWQSPQPAVTPNEYGHGDFGIWNYDYIIYHTADDVIATVHYTGATVASLQAYATANRQLAAQLAQTEGGVRVDITFRTYVAPDSFRDWVRRHHLYVGWSGVRLLDEQGNRQDFSVPMIQSDPYPQAWVDQVLAQGDGPQPPVPLAPAAPPPGAAGQPPTPAPPAATPILAPADNQAKPGRRGATGTSVRGVFYVSALADAKELPALVQDPLVFLVDVTPNIVRRELLGQGVDVMHSGLGWVLIDPPSPFRQMEDLGLEQFR